MKKSFNGAGRPVLVPCLSQYATCTIEGDNLMIIIPRRMGFGAHTYFDGVQKISHKVYCEEFDGDIAPCDWGEFIQVDDATLMENLNSPLVSAEFKAKALELIKECPLENE